MSERNNGEEDNNSGYNKENNESEKNQSQDENKSEEKISIEDENEILDDSASCSDSKEAKPTLDVNEYHNVEVIIQSLHTVQNQDTIIALPECISETTMTSSKSNLNFCAEDTATSTVDIPNSVFVVSSDGRIHARCKQTKKTDIGTQDDVSQVDSFHRKDYQVMMYLRGVHGAVGTVSAAVRIGKALRESGVKPCCVMQGLSNMIPGRPCSVNCNAYVSHVMFLLFMMLLATAYCLNYCMTRPRSRYWYYINWWQIILSTILVILFLNYLMFSCMMERYMALNYICLIMAVIACSMFVSAISARIENDAFWIANLMTAATVLFLFLLSFANVDFSHRMLALISVLFSVLVLLFICYTNKSYGMTEEHYSGKVLYFSGFLGSLRVFLMVIELQRLICSCASTGCCDHTFGAFILYTLYLQFIFFIFQWFPLRRC